MLASIALAGRIAPARCRRPVLLAQGI